MGQRRLGVTEMATRRKNQTSDPQQLLTLMLMAIVVCAAVGPWLMLRLTDVFRTQEISANPIIWWTESRFWDVPATIGTIICSLVVLAAAVAIGWVRSAQSYNKVYTIAATQLARSVKPFRGLMRRGATKEAARLGVRSSPGIALGLLRPFENSGPKRMLYSSWEHTLLIIAGPRKMKTTAYAVPQLCAAPGSAIATSNKLDLYRTTVGVREEISGSAGIWLFDPLGLETRNAHAFSWNPLSFIEPRRSGAIMRAQILTDELMGPSQSKDSGHDSSWENIGKDLLVGVLVGAAMKRGGTLADAYRWLSEPEMATRTELAELLGTPELDALRQSTMGILDTTPRQRDGYLAHARSAISWMREPQIARLVTPGSGLRSFDPVAFVQSSDTLYIVSEADNQAATPLITALVRVCFETAKDYANMQPSGRLPTPMVMTLDEAANICRLSNLPELYSHAGSRGIIICAILQTWPQGEKVWGRHGMAMMWGTASVRIYGGGEADLNMLTRIQEACGYHDVETTSRTDGGRSSVQHSINRRWLLEKNELMELPTGWAVCSITNYPTMLIEPIPYWKGPLKDKLTSTKPKTVQTLILEDQDAYRR